MDLYKNKKTITSMTLAFALLASAGLSPCLVKPVFAQATLQASSAIEGTKSALSDFDGKLEFPMSESERSESQAEVNSFRTSFKTPSPTSLSADQVNSAAEAALTAAKAAGQEATSGDRKVAIKKFTEARIALLKARALLTAFESLPTGKSSPQLSAGARKDDQLLEARRATSGFNSGIPNSSVGDGSSSVHIGPTGIRVLEQSSSGVNRTDVNISPGSISVRDSGTPGFGSTTTIDINSLTGQAPNGSLGQAINNLVSGTVNSALGTAQTATSTALGAAGFNSSGATTGNTVSVTGSYQERSLNLKGQNLVITGRHNNLHITGFCNSISVTGHGNEVTLDLVNNISVTGHDNRVLWRNGPNGAQPATSLLGRKNQISRIH